MSEEVELLRKIYGLLELLAEDKIAERDAKQRTALQGIVGASPTKQKSIFLMDGTRTQSEIASVTAVNKGHLSTMVGNLLKVGLLAGDTKKPKLGISIPQDFFEKNAKTS